MVLSIGPDRRIADVPAVRSQRIRGSDGVTALAAASLNLRRLGSARLACWDARALPLPDRSIDRIVCNPPFGKQLSRPEEIGPLYRRFVQECDRVLRPRGRAVMLVSDQQALKEAAAALAWNSLRQLRVRVLGQPAFLSVWTKE